ncbi:hypothetical protein GMMP13_220024 [Candidatus Magnetomoraceae bacterium gMMP-13]
MKDISSNIKAYKKQLEFFLDNLDVERFYIKLSLERFYTSKILLAQFANDKIVAVAGIEKWHGLDKSYFLIRKDFQGKGIGKKISSELNNHAIKKGLSYFLGVLNKKNIGMLKVCIATNYKIIGNLKNIIYLIVPCNKKGTVLYYLLKIGFSLLTFIISVMKRDNKS